MIKHHEGAIEMAKTDARVFAIFAISMALVVRTPVLSERDVLTVEFLRGTGLAGDTTAKR